MKEIKTQIEAIITSLQVLSTLVEAVDKKQKSVEGKYIKLLSELKKQAGKNEK